MNDEQKLPPESNTLPDSPEGDLRFAPPPASESQPETPSAAEMHIPAADSLDIEAALAAVSNLGDALAEQTLADEARLAQESVDLQAPAERQAPLEQPKSTFPAPPLMTLQRGQLASVIPALLLILIGAWLTLTITTSDTPPDAGLVRTVVVASAAAILLIRWLASGRWARGSLFFGLALVFVGISVLYLSLTPPDSPGIARGWPLLAASVGLAVLLTAVLGYPAHRRLVFPGLMLIVAGGAGLVVTLGLLSADFLNAIAPFWPAAVGVFVVLWLLPVVVKQRS